MNKALILAVILLLAVLVGSLWRSVNQRRDAGPDSPDSLEAQLVESFQITAARVNDKAPFHVGEKTRLDGATVGPGAQITYKYTLTEFNAGEIDFSILNSDLMPDIVENACGNEQIMFSLQHGGVYVYEYYGKDDVQIGSFTLDRKVCESP